MSLFEELRAAGEVDSKGQFTLEPRRAWEKLRTFQFAQPERYVLALLASAIMGEATYFRYKTGTFSDSIEYDSKVPSVADLNDLWGRLFADGTSALQEFAMGVNGAARLKEVTIEVCDGDNGSRLTLKDLQATPFKPRGKPAPVRITLGHAMLETAAEVHVLEEAARFAPINVGVNDSRLEREMVEIGTPLAGVVFRSTSNDVAVRLPSLHGTLRQEVWDRPWSAVVWIDGSDASNSELTLLVNGSVFRLDVVLHAHLHAVIAAPHLHWDLSHQAIVEDEAYRDMLGVLQNVAQGLLRDVAHNLDRLKASGQALALDLLQNDPLALYEVMQFETDTWLLQAVQTRPHLWLSIAEALIESGNREEARSLLNEHAPTLLGTTALLGRLLAAAEAFQGPVPWLPRCLLRIADIKLCNGQRDEAVRLVDAAYDHAVKAPNAENVLVAQMLLRFHEPDKALALVEAENLPPSTRPQALALRGRIYRDQGKPREALQMYYEALRCVPPSETNLVKQLQESVADLIPAGTTPQACPRCGSHSIQPGTLHSTFTSPITGERPIAAAACLECGHVDLSLAP